MQSKTIEDQLASGSDLVPQELPSIKATILKPKFLLIALGFSLVMNLLLLIAAISGAGESSSPAITPVPSRVQTSSSPSLTPRATVRPSSTASEAIIRLKNCFSNCNAEEVLAMIREEALSISHIKASILFESETGNNCYGTYLEATSPDRQVDAYHTLICAGKKSIPPQDTVHVADNLYTLNASGNWDLGSRTRIGQTKLVSVIDVFREQQTKTLTDTNLTDGYKQITSTSKVINELNQQVNRKAVLIFNEYLEVVSYEIEVERVSKEKGFFFDRNVENSITEPI